MENHKRKKCGGSGVESLRDKLLLMNIDLDTKSFIVEKYDSTQKLSGSDYSKSMNWLRTVSKIPYGKYKTLPVSKTDTQETIKNFLNFNLIVFHETFRFCNSTYIVFPK